MRRTFSLLAVCVLVCTASLWAQDNSAADILYLRSGKIETGVITFYKARDFVKLRKSSDGIVTTYPLAAVERIEQSQETTDAPIQIPYLFRTPIQSEVTLKDGNVHQGEVVEYIQGEYLNLKLADKSILTLADTDIAKMTYQSLKMSDISFARENERQVAQRWQAPVKKPREKPVYAFSERGLFHTTSFCFTFGKRDRLEFGSIFNPVFEPTPTTETAVGFNLQHITGFQFNRWAGLGLGLSYDAYDLEKSEAVLSVFAHYRAYLTKKIVAPYVGLSAGYGFPTLNKTQGIKETQGGLMMHPELGLRLGATNKTNFTISGGYRFQDAYFVQEVPFSGVIEYRNVSYRRFVLSVGLLF